MLVIITISVPGNTNCIFVCDSNATPTTIITQPGTGNLPASENTAVSFIVLPGYYYKATQSGGVTLTKWIEYL